ncbi:MAG: putative transcriptional regulator, TetR family [Rhodospirillales bacterium]|jgi:AcrR family transcriptional regulator|nr:putative transcriptional regulator, TetR family [Rhodospirillales bacterium]
MAADTQATRWRRRKDARTPEIIEAALECFGERGFAACRLDDIARRAGVTKGTIYLYFPNKEELFKAVISRSLVPRIVAGEQVVAASDLPAPVQLERLLLTLAEIIPSSTVGAIPKLIIAEAGNFPEIARFYFDEVISRGRRLITGILRRGIARGEFREIDVDATFFSVVAPLIVALLWKRLFEVHDDAALDTAALCRSHLQLLMHGMAP